MLRGFLLTDIVPKETAICPGAHHTFDPGCQSITRIQPKAQTIHRYRCFPINRHTYRCFARGSVTICRTHGHRLHPWLGQGPVGLIRRFAQIGQTLVSTQYLNLRHFPIAIRHTGTDLDCHPNIHPMTITRCHNHHLRPHVRWQHRHGKLSTRRQQTLVNHDYVYLVSLGFGFAAHAPLNQAARGNLHAGRLVTKHVSQL